MDAFTELIGGFGTALTFTNLGWAFMGALLGTLIGAGGGALLGRSVDRGQVVCR